MSNQDLFDLETSSALLAASPFMLDIVKWAETNPLTVAQIKRDEQAGVDVYSTLCLMQRAHSLAHWGSCGYNVFNITHSLADKLLLTDVSARDLYLPFPAFGILLPNKYLESADAPGDYLQKVLVSTYLGNNNRFVSWRVDSLTASGSAWVNLGELPKYEIRSKDQRTVFHLLKALCSFLGTQQEMLVADNEASAGSAKSLGIAKIKTFVVGRTVKFSPQLRSLLKQRRASNAPVWKLEHKYMVRGHFRYQPIGPTNIHPRNAKRIWIEPFWKGPEESEAWRHTYECDLPPVVVDNRS